MKTSLYKIFLSSIFLISALGFYSCSDENPSVPESDITIDQLPSVAQSFLKSYFPDVEAKNIVEMKEDEMVLYQVYLENGFEIVFNSEGYWQQVVAGNDMTVPNGIIPEQILQTLTNQYHGYGVVSINTEGQNYHVVLSNNQGGSSIDLVLNQSGEIISGGDMD